MQNRQKKVLKMNTSPAVTSKTDLHPKILETIKNSGGSIIVQIIKTPSGEVFPEILELGIISEELLHEIIKKLQKVQRTEKAKKLSQKIKINWGEELFLEKSNLKDIDVLETGVYHRELENGNTQPIQITFYLSEIDKQKEVSVSVSQDISLSETENLALMINYNSKFKKLREKYEEIDRIEISWNKSLTSLGKGEIDENRGLVLLNGIFSVYSINSPNIDYQVTFYKYNNKISFVINDKNLKKPRGMMLIRLEQKARVKLAELEKINLH